VNDVNNSTFTGPVQVSLRLP